MPASPPSRCKSRLHSFSGQGTLVLGKCPEDMEQKLSMRCVRVHAFRHRPERDAAVAQAGHDVKQVGQRAAETVEFPHDERVAGLQEVEAALEAGTVVAHARCLVLEQMAGINAGSDQGRGNA